MKLEDAIRSAMDEHGVTGPGYRIKVVWTETLNQGSSDWATVTVDVYRPRYRKPCVTWELAIWIPGNTLYWEKSRHYNR